MRKELLAALALALASAPAWAQQAGSKTKPPVQNLDSRPWKYFFSYDYFLPTNAGRGLKGQLKDQASALISSGYKTADVSLNVSGGTGARFGALHRVNSRADLGLSLGYIIGPTMNASLSASGGPGPGGLSISRDVVFLRYLAQGHLIFPLNNHWKALFGAGLGAATGVISRGCDESGTLTCSLRTARRTWTGFTWEVTPSLAYHLRRGDLRFGARYAEFPRYRGNGQIASIDWATFGFFIGATF
jgi:opacity protein-like surface antigen